MKHDTALGSKPDKKAIAKAIQRYLDANGLARKDLIREHLSKSSIEKLFQGDFTERTLNKVEGILKTSFQKQATPRENTAAKSVGEILAFIRPAFRGGTPRSSGAAQRHQRAWPTDRVRGSGGRPAEICRARPRAGHRPNP